MFTNDPEGLFFVLILYQEGRRSRRGKWGHRVVDHCFNSVIS